MPTDALPFHPHRFTASPFNRPRLTRLRRKDLSVIAVEASPVSEFHITATSRPGESRSDLVARVTEVLHAHRATVVRAIAFGPIREQNPTVAALRQAAEDPLMPVIWVEGESCTGELIAGVQIHAIAGTTVQTVGSPESMLGRKWADSALTHCVLGPLIPNQVNTSAPEQAVETFNRLQVGLTQAGMTLRDVVRTWFFLKDILSWYREFNVVRNDCFARNELRAASVPASTGVSGQNPANAALTAVAWAMQAHRPEGNPVEFVTSPKQCPAPVYGSAFSRAVALHSPGFRQLLVSGTASIAPDGRTVHAGDVRAQIGLSMQVVNAILESRGMQLTDVTRATAYFKSGADAPLFKSWLEDNGLIEMPVVSTVCNICRQDLLFEIEVDAVQQSSGE